MSISRYDIPMGHYVDDFPSAFDKINVPENNPVAAGVQHNELYGRNSHCNFGIQEHDIVDFCPGCSDLSNSRPGWKHPDCQKMLSQHDIARILDIYTMYTKEIQCHICHEYFQLHTLTEVEHDVFVCDTCFEDNYFVCDRCGNILPIEEQSDDDETFCESCMAEHVGACEDCGEIIFDDEDYFSDDNHILCDSCADNYTMPCSWCGNRYHIDDISSDDCGTHLCPECQENACSCDSCGRYVTDENIYVYHDEYYCHDCYEDLREHCQHIHGYGWEPENYVFLKAQDQSDMEYDTFYGLELEIDTDENRFDAMVNCATELNDVYKDILWMTTDGSLSRCGIELKTMPATFDYHMQELPWKDILHICKSHGYESHSCGTCGLHIHISKTAFGHMRSMQDGNIAKFLYLMEKFWDQMIIFSRRTPANMSRWARKYDLANVSSTQSISEEAYNKNHCERHHCVNLLRSETVEVRIFRGTLNASTVKAAIQLCDMMRMICMTASLEEIHSMTWNVFKNYAQADRYSELVGYLEKREL